MDQLYKEKLLGKKPLISVSKVREIKSEEKFFTKPFNLPHSDKININMNLNTQI